MNHISGGKFQESSQPVGLSTDGCFQKSTGRKNESTILTGPMHIKKKLLLFCCFTHVQPISKGHFCFCWFIPNVQPCFLSSDEISPPKGLQKIPSETVCGLGNLQLMQLQDNGHPAGELSQIKLLMGHCYLS